MPVPAGGSEDLDASADLFEIEDLELFLQRDLDTPTAILARRVAGSWLMAATKLTAWPDPIPGNLFGWALELAALAYVNPEGLTTETVGGETSTWDKSRRAAILAEARAAYDTPTSGQLPVWSFPPSDLLWPRI
jgi:hypothetical protein